jgi:hypothetical protein
MKNERLMLPRFGYSYNAEDGSDGKTPVRVETGLPDVKPGDTMRQPVAAPGIGTIVWRVTRIDKRGAWGVISENTAREMTATEAM